MIQPKRTMNGSSWQESFSSRSYFFTFSFHTMSVQPVRRMMSECHTRILNVFSRRQQVCVLELCLRHQTQVVDSTSFILLLLSSSLLPCVYVWCTWQSFLPSYWDLRERKTERTFYRQESNRGNHLFWEGAKGKIIYHDGRQTDITDSDERDEASRKNAPHWDAGIECSCKGPSAGV